MPKSALGNCVRLDARTKLLNPKWYEGMLNHGYEGVREVSKRLVNMGWSLQLEQWITGFLRIPMPLFIG